MSEINYAYEQKSTFQQSPQFIPKREELKPCPFCGTIPKIIKRNVMLYPYAIDHGDGLLDYQCPLDWMVFADYSTEEKAINHWNRRYEE